MHGLDDFQVVNVKLWVLDLKVLWSDEDTFLEKGLVNSAAVFFGDNHFEL